MILITLIAAIDTLAPPAHIESQLASSSPWKLQSAQELITHDRFAKSGREHHNRRLISRYSCDLMLSLSFTTKLFTVSLFSSGVEIGSGKIVSDYITFFSFEYS